MDLFLKSLRIKGFQKNKLAILAFKACGRQGVKTLKSNDIPSFYTGSQTGYNDVQNIKLLLSGPQALVLRNFEVIIY